jgi:GNAT superfamily N-acetyltransferase
MSRLRFGALKPQHRARLAEILEATAAFSREEIAVALELFDETFEGGRGPAKRAGRVEGGVRSPLPSTLNPPPSTYEFLGAFDERGTLIGYACYGATPGASGVFDLYWIAVHPRSQGIGGGTGLLSEVERRLHRRGGRLLLAETSSRPHYAPTRRFYDRRGYRESARVSDFYGPTDDRVIYSKPLRRDDTGRTARRARGTSLVHHPTDPARSASP